MPDLIQAFRDKADDLLASINRKGGVRATIESLRHQMEVADRRRALSTVRAELKRLDKQINEMITAVGIQAVGLHEAGKLASPELAPLCQHVVELRAALAQQQTELANLEALESQTVPADCATCQACGRSQPADATFCPYCGAALPQQERYCSRCGATLRSGARFCAKCGQAVAPKP
ncbi:MAG: zinc-ribbon domain-containing protein [Chloroflexi bacterium]|nr:zinc-ribbon domain-containing protein [Chloroflexota bacterium]